MNKVALHMVTDLSEKIAEIEAENESRVTEFLNASNERLDRLDDTTTGLKVIKTNKDAEGIHTTVTYRRKSDNTLHSTSVLSGGTTPKYTTRTITRNATDGTTVISTVAYTLSYDADGVLISEV